MPDDDKIRVRARGTALCTDYDAADREPPLRRVLGRKYQEVTPGQFGWVPSGEDEVVRKRPEVARAIADGDLYAADQATADWAHSITRSVIEFDPTFGGSVSSQKAISETPKTDKADKAWKAAL